MTDTVRAQYEAFPYPERKPTDERKRLITGSPSLPVEMDHWLWGGARDWSQPLKALVAGGGTGDALIQLAQKLTDAGRPNDITYLDLSQASRRIAEKRAEVRKLSGITFVTGSLLDAGDYGPFDYIDCCGVLHHLSDPQAGFNALAGALKPDGGIGLMVYAPHGRSGVYPLQDAFNTLLHNLPPEKQLKAAKRVFDRLPDAHPFKRNQRLVDHKNGDAGFYDLLLHSQDRPFTITALIEALNAAGLDYAGAPEAMLYDPAPLLDDESGLDPVADMQLAEDLRGTFKTHIAYARPKGQVIAPPLGRPDAVPHLRDMDAAAVANHLAKGQGLTIDTAGASFYFDIPAQAAPLVARVDGHRPVADIAPSETDLRHWAVVEAALCPSGLMHYSRLLVGQG
ncbi:bifunctional 2-polyprenyl-6-hydroxyphenol methylase/3-demethylubiquinol 3-O-methyltransferase UbiG [uncultured Tateyamaria sp.]|uniref:class I SAM-dependent methyltransferase n=1 Tax=uncultured Tateyamaria sp. TaxID=455651 RepID=UPI00260C38D0|nr:class I SAM-dependent methyltransferase [uncultured Tateyamaria sp.]